MNPFLSPDSFNSLLSDHRNSPSEPHKELFKMENDIFFCARPTLSATCHRLWIIDADDTLWEDNIHFENLVAEFTDYVLSHGAGLDRHEIRAVVDDVEHETIPVHGFGAQGFYLSLREAWRRIREQHVPAAPDPEGFFDKIVPHLSGVPYEVPQSTYDFLNRLREFQNDTIVLFTQGPLEIQLDKIANSKLAPSFDAIAIGRNKHIGTYRKLLDLVNVEADEYVVVGNSINSEILPAIDMGFRAFHFNNPNSWHSVNSAVVDRSKYTSVDSLLDIFSGL